MTLPFGCQDQMVLKSWRFFRRGRLDGAAAIVELNRQSCFERRTNQPTLFKRPSAEDEQSSAAFAHEFRGERELCACEEVALEIGNHDRVILEQRLSGGGKPRRESRGTTASGLHEKCVGRFFVFAFAHDRVDFEPWIL